MYNNGYGAVCEFDEDSRGRTVATPYYCRCYRSKMSSYCKKLTNRKVRRYKGEIHKGGNYRRVFDMWWELDQEVKMEVREFLESLGMDLKKPIAQDIYDGQGIILGEYERFLESQTSMAAAMSLAEVYANCNNAYDEMNNNRKIKLLKKSIKHCRNPLEKKGLEKQLNKAYKERKKQKHEK